MIAADAKAKIFELLDSGIYDFGAALDCAIAAGFKDNDAKYFVYDAWHDHRNRVAQPASVAEPVPAPIPEPPPAPSEPEPVPPKVIASPGPPKPVDPTPSVEPAVAGPETFEDFLWGKVWEQMGDDAEVIQPDSIAVILSNLKYDGIEFPDGMDKNDVRALIRKLDAERRGEEVVETPPPREQQKRKALTYAEKKRAFKEHKLKPTVIPPILELRFSDHWRKHPGFEDLYIHRDQFAVQLRSSRRRGGLYWHPVAIRSFEGKSYFVHWKRNKRTMVPVHRAMYETGHWFAKKKSQEDE